MHNDIANIDDLESSLREEINFWHQYIQYSLSSAAPTALTRAYEALSLAEYKLSVHLNLLQSNDKNTKLLLH